MEKLNKSKRMSQIVIHGDTIYLAGQVAADTKQGMKGQTESVLGKIDALLTTAGTNKSKLLMARALLMFNIIYQSYIRK